MPHSWRTQFGAISVNRPVSFAISIARFSVAHERVCNGRSLQLFSRKSIVGHDMYDYTTVFITPPLGTIFHARLLHSSWDSVGADNVGVGSISPRAFRRRTYRSVLAPSWLSSKSRYTRKTAQGVCDKTPSCSVRSSFSERSRKDYGSR